MRSKLTVHNAVFIIENSMKPLLTPDQISDIKLAAKKMAGFQSRQFKAEMTLKYFEGNCRKAERTFGWGRETVKKGIHELKSGYKCVNANAARCGAKLWEVKNPIAANKLIKIAEEHSQQDPSFNSTIAYTRLSAEKAIVELEKAGCSKEELPSARSMRDILNRMGFRLRRVVKAKPLKKVPLTNDIFSNISQVDSLSADIKKTDQC